MRLTIRRQIIILIKRRCQQIGSNLPPASSDFMMISVSSVFSHIYCCLLKTMLPIPAWPLLSSLLSCPHPSCCKKPAAKCQSWQNIFWTDNRRGTSYCSSCLKVLSLTLQTNCLHKSLLVPVWQLGPPLTADSRDDCLLYYELFRPISPSPNKYRKSIEERMYSFIFRGRH